MHITSVRPLSPTPPPTVRMVGPDGEPRDVVVREVRFEPEVTPRTLFAGGRVGAGRDVAYYDATADAADRAAYYGERPARWAGMDGKALYQDLNRLVSDTHKPLRYDPEEHLYPWVDRRPDLQLDSIYSPEADQGTGGDPGGLWILADGEGPSTMVYSQKENKIYNCEHVVPQSWFDKSSVPRADLHHLFTCDIDCNSTRGNAVYFDFPGKSAEVFPNCGLSDPGSNRFEPYGGKGAVARAVLYFLLRYPGKVGDERGEYGPKDVEMLKNWSRENPVSEYEQHRNRAIQGKQGNRNPLVDFPELVEKVDFAQGLG